MTNIVTSKAAANPRELKKPKKSIWCMYSKINFLKILNFVLIVKSCKTKS